MIVRLGNLLYWLGCAAAALFAAMGFYCMVELPAQSPGLPLFFAAMAFGLWPTGRAARYLFAGR